MTSPAEDLGKFLAGTSGGGMQTISAQVVDVTDTGVNLTYQGTLLIDVVCADSYAGRRAGDWVAVRPGTVPVVLWRLGPDPATTGAPAQAVSALTWGTGLPPGPGWQTVTQMYVRADSSGQGQLYAQLGTLTTPSPPDPGPGPATITPADSGSWRGGRPDSYVTSPVQGDWTGGGNRRGAWFYGTKIADACAGHTVATMKAAFTRKTGAGANAKRPLHLYLHNYTSAPPGQLDLGDGPESLLSLSAGGRGTATLPAAWRTALASGSARGLAIYAAGSSDYMAVTGGTVTITFSA
jgi:hypothetical protein